MEDMSGLSWEPDLIVTKKCLLVNSTPGAHIGSIIEVTHSAVEGIFFFSIIMRNSFNIDNLRINNGNNN